jgi:hypothetical protein
LQQESWNKSGLIVWEAKSKKVARPSATEALSVLEHLRTDNAWTEHGVVVGEPTTRIVLGEPERKPEPSLLNPINVSPRQTKLLLQLLEKYEPRLVQMSEEEEEERGRRLWNAYRILLDLAERKERSEATNDGASQR